MYYWLFSWLVVWCILFNDKKSFWWKIFSVDVLFNILFSGDGDNELISWVLILLFVIIKCWVCGNLIVSLVR